MFRKITALVVGLAAMSSLSVLADEIDLTGQEAFGEPSVEAQAAADAAQDAGDGTQEIDIDLTEDSKSELILSGNLTAAETEDGISRYRTGWSKAGDVVRYILSDNTPATGVIEIDGSWYLFNDDGSAACGWTEYEGRKAYCFLGGLLASGAVDIGDDIYLFDKQGHPVSGWFEEGGLRYGDADGKAVTGWFEDGGSKYLASDDGTVIMGWLLHEGEMYYQTPQGIVSGPTHVDGQMRLFLDDGRLASGKVVIDGIMYLADDAGYPMTGLVKTEEGIYGTNANGMILTGWQTIDGELHHFDNDGLATYGVVQTNEGFLAFDESGRPAFGDIPNDEDGGLCISYNAPLYEGELPDPGQLDVGFTRPLFGMREDSITVSPDGDAWTEEAYGTSVLEVRTEIGSGSIEVPVVSVDHVEAAYKGTLHEGDIPIIQDVEVTVVYADGHRKPITDFTCDLPDHAEKGAQCRVYSDYGNATLTIPVAKIKNLHVEYNGSVREGELPDPSKYTVWTKAKDGSKKYLETFLPEKKRIFKNTKVTVYAGNASATCRITCSKINKIVTAGILYDGDSLTGRNLVVRYEDGGVETWYPGDYEWIGDPKAVLGESFRAVTFMGNRYSTYLDVVQKNEPQSQGLYYNTSGLAAGETYGSRTSLGIWTLTAYADTPHDQGPYVGQTASGAALVEGRTVAVSKATMERLGLQFGDRLEINGHVYTIEDHGGSAMDNQNWVDIFVSDPAREYDAAYNTPSEVFLLR